MISNMQQQNFGGGVVNKLLSHETTGLCINNNNTNKNKNMNVTSSGVMHNQDPKGYHIINTFDIRSSNNAKEYATAASQNRREEGFTSLLDEITELIENNPNQLRNKPESAFNNQCSDNNNIKQNHSSADQKIPKSSTLTNDSRRNAFRFIDDIHNYSKLNRSDDSTNSSSQDDDDFADNSLKCINGKKTARIERGESKRKDVHGNFLDKSPQDNGVPDDEEEKTTPEHHARRPMNAFLIFCKRHRAIVREKYKHLENRSITKILGEWWASLNDEEKTSYTNLAKQYKDAFFTANPNFKWYKLPAPPLRTLSTRPCNSDRPLLSSNNNYSLAHNYERGTIKTESDDDTQDVSEMGVFKLADVAQMGGLNSLMISSNNCVTQKIDSVNRIICSEQNIPHHESVSNDGDLCKTGESLDHMRQYSAKTDAFPMSNGKRKHTEETNANGCKRQILFNDSVSSGDEDVWNKKSERSCKGKKYQELMNSGQIITSTKKIKSKSEMISGTYAHNGYVHHQHDGIFMLSPTGKVKTEELSPSDHSKINSIGIENPVKQFDASDFDLEHKIKALPAQSLDEYLQRKRETKNKKKINSKRYKAHRNLVKEPPKTIQEAKERIQSQMVGSQKRKARKESITRRDINSIMDHSDGPNPICDNVEIWASATIKSDPDNTALRSRNPVETTSDLLILAEVAANHIEDA